MIWNTSVTGGPAWWQWGSRRIWVHVDGAAVRVGVDGGDDARADDLVRCEPGPVPEEMERFVRAAETEVQWCARTADRSVVVRPASPLTVLPEATTEIYVSTPLWIGLRDPGDSEPFFEVPSYLPTNTWFGETPQAGELAYASKTRARACADQLDFLPGRAITRVTLVNHQEDPWEIERLKVPVPHLPLYHSDSTGVWTAGLRVECAGETEVDAVVESAAPSSAGPATLFQPARDTATPRLLLRALGSLGWS